MLKRVVLYLVSIGAQYKRINRRRIRSDAMLDDDRSPDYYSNRNEIIEIGKRHLVTRGGKHRSGTWTHIEGCYSLPYERRLQRRKKFSSAATEDDEIEYDNKSN